MKKYLFLVLLAVVSVAACKKDAAPKASFTTAKSGYYLNQAVTISNTSSGSSYNWDFGDGGSSTAQSPTHTYVTSGTFVIKLTVNGTSTASKSITIYNGTASYQVSNQTEVSLPLVSFSVDNSGNLVDFQDDGTIASDALSDTVFTTDATIYIGGTLPDDSTFIAIYPHPISLYTNNIIALADTSEVYVSSVKQQTINSFFHLRTNAVRTTLKPRLAAVKHTVQ